MPLDDVFTLPMLRYTPLAGYELSFCWARTIPLSMKQISTGAATISTNSKARKPIEKEACSYTVLPGVSPVLLSDTTYISIFPLCLEIDKCISRVLLSCWRCCQESQIQ
jgi:hypothetical protein